MAEYLRELGLAVGAGATEADILLVDARTRAGRGAVGRLDDLHSTSLVGIAVGGGYPSAPRPTGRLVRVLELIASSYGAGSSLLLSRRLARRLRAAGFAVASIPTGDRSRRHGIGRSGWLSRRRVPVGWIVTGTRNGPHASSVLASVASFAEAHGRPVVIDRADVLESGKTAVRLLDDTGTSFYMHLAAGHLSERLKESRRNLAELIGRRPPEAVLGKLVEPLAQGEVGPLTYVVEKTGHGSHPALLTEQQWREALDFLLALHRLPHPPGTPSPDAYFATVADQLTFVWPHLSERERRTVEQLPSRLELALEHVPLGLRHGDFWAENLLFDEGRLTAVLDWEWSSTSSIPLFDVLDLASTARWRDRHRSFGSRFAHVLVPLAEGDAHPAFVAYLGAQGLSGVAGDHETLTTLLAAYWLDWVTRELQTAPGHEAASEWLADNLHKPLEHIESACGQQSASVSRRRPAFPPIRRAPVAKDILILCYHATSPTWDSDLSVQPHILTRQITRLVREGYRGATFRDALTSTSGKTFAVTFDDAYTSVFEHARPALEALHVPATVFVPTSFPDSGRPLSWSGIEAWLETPDAKELECMTWDQLRELAAAGWEIGSHTHSHPHLTELDEPSLDDELSRSKLLCEEQIAAPCVSIAYPYGDVDDRVADAAARVGYAWGATLPVGYPAPAPLLWPRVGIYGRGDLEFRAKTSRQVRALRMRYARRSG